MGEAFCSRVLDIGIINYNIARCRHSRTRLHIIGSLPLCRLLQDAQRRPLRAFAPLHPEISKVLSSPIEGRHELQSQGNYHQGQRQSPVYGTCSEPLGPQSQDSAGSATQSDRQTQAAPPRLETKYARPRGSSSRGIQYLEPGADLSVGAIEPDFYLNRKKTGSRTPCCWQSC